MKHTIANQGGIGLRCTAVILALTPLFGSWAQTPGVFIGVPPADARRQVSTTALRFNAQFEAEINLACEGKRVRVIWRYAPAGDFRCPAASLAEEFAVGYWPTAVESSANNRILVAGKERSGATRIERWTLKKPLVLGNPTGGPVSLSAQGQQDVTPVYDGSVVGKDMVCGLLRKRGSENKVYVHFFDSGDLYELDSSSEPFALTLMTSHTSQPALAVRYDSYAAGDHQQQGYVYVLSNRESLGTVPAFVLKDTNRDGVIDWQGTMTTAVYQQQQLGDRTRWFEYCGH